MRKRSNDSPAPVTRLHTESRWRETHRLLDQQLWCLGRDVVELPGNALLQWGLERVSPPSRVYHHSYYRGTRCGADVVLWSWGLYHRVQGGDAILLRRARLDPVFVDGTDPPEGVWTSELVVGRRLANTEAEVDRFLVAAARAFEWLAEYEHWVRREFGARHRVEVVSRWRSPVVVGEDIAGHWHRLAAWCTARADSTQGHSVSGEARREFA